MNHSGTDTTIAMKPTSVAPNAPSAPGEAVPTEIKLGAVLPLTGSFATSRKYFQQGYQMAIDEWNGARRVSLKVKQLRAAA